MVHSFILIGQSNMAGRGFTNDVAPILDKRIKMLRNGRWKTMTEPINYDRFFSGIGPAASFAQAWTDTHPDEEIGLIPCADGGTKMDDWAPGGQLFDHAVMQTRLAQRISTIDGILWHQGENDCPDELIPVYEGKLERFFTSFREQLGLEHTPLMIGGLGDYLPKCPRHDFFKNAPVITELLHHYADTHEDCWFVTAAGLTSNPDMIHFNAVSQRLFGRRYFTAYNERRNVETPLEGEDDIAAGLMTYAQMTRGEKAAYLKRYLDDGTITGQEYSFRVDLLN